MICNLQVLLEQRATPEQKWQWDTGKAQGSKSSFTGETLPALLVGNTHLLFNPKRGDIKVAAHREVPCQPHSTAMRLALYLHAWHLFPKISTAINGPRCISTKLATTIQC